MSDIKEVESHSICGYSALTGIEWLSPDDDTDITARIRAEGLQKPRVFTNHLSSGAQNGFCSLKALKAQKKLVSAAALYAKAQISSDLGPGNSWVVIDSLTNGYWVSLIADGVILTETGAQLTKDEAEEEALRFCEASQAEGHTVLFAGSALNEFSIPDEQCVNVDLNSIISSFTKKDIASTAPAGESVNLGKYLLFLCVLLGIGYFYSVVFDINLNLLSKSPEEIRIEQEQQSIVAAENYYRQLQEEPTLQSALPVIDQLISETDLLDAPWPLRVLNCQFMRGSCIATFVNTGNNSTKPLKAYSESRCVSFDLDPQGFSANCAFRYSPPFQDSDRGESIVDLTEQLLTFSKLGFKTKLMNPVSSNIPGAIALPQQYLHREGVWEVSGNYLKLTNVIRDLPHIDWIKVRGVKVQISQDPTKTTSMVIEGAYVLH